MAKKNTPAARAGTTADTTRLAFWLLLAVLVIVLDQFTKWLIVGHYRLGDVTPVTSFFNVVRAHNTGAAFSFLAQAGGWQRWLFTGLGAAAALFIVALVGYGLGWLFDLITVLMSFGGYGSNTGRTVVSLLATLFAGAAKAMVQLFIFRMIIELVRNTAPRGEGPQA